MSPNGALSFNSYSEYENEENFKKWMKIFTTSPEHVLKAVGSALTNYEFKRYNNDINPEEYYICLSEYMDSFIIINSCEFFQFEYSHGGTLYIQGGYQFDTSKVKMNYHASDEEKNYDKRQILDLINTSVINVKKLIDELNYYIERNKNSEY